MTSISLSLCAGEQQSQTASVRWCTILGHAEGTCGAVSHKDWFVEFQLDRATYNLPHTSPVSAPFHARAFTITESMAPAQCAFFTNIFAGPHFPSSRFACVCTCCSMLGSINGSSPALGERALSHQALPLSVSHLGNLLLCEAVANCSNVYFLHLSPLTPFDSQCKVDVTTHTKRMAYLHGVECTNCRILSKR